MSTEITIHGISKHYGRGKKAVEVLKAIELTLAPGELFFLLGPSGCGKTTLLRIIAGLIAPTSGRILFNGKDITQTPVEKRDTAMVFQNYALWPHMTVLDNVAFGPKMRGASAAEQKKIALETLRLVEMDSFSDRKPTQLSGGQQQRVALARAMAVRPACLLLDEPLSNLDAKLRSQMRTELRRLIKASGTTAIYVTHDQKEALSMADRVGVMHRGRIVQTAPPEELYRAPSSVFTADFAGEANFVHGRVRTTTPLEVETAVGIFVSDTQTDLQPGDAAVCCIRPESLHLAATAVGNVNTPAATAEEICYLGQTWHIGFRLDHGELWHVISLTKPKVQPSERCHLSVSSEDIIVLPPESDNSSATAR